MRRFGYVGLVLTALCTVALPIGAAAQASMSPACDAAMRAGGSLDTVEVRRCIADESSEPLATAVLRDALSRGADSSAVAQVAVAGARTSYRRAVNTARPDHFRETVGLALLADSLRPSPIAQFLGAVASVHIWKHLEGLTTCAAAREGVQYLEIARRYPFRPDPGLEPDSMKLEREVEEWLRQARSHVRARCTPSTRRAP
jgi:hypothetical protein